MAATIFTTADIAAKFETTPRTLRKFLRSTEGMDSKVGKGKRWGIEAKQVRSLEKRFTAWQAANAKATAPDEVEVTDEALTTA